MSIIKIASFGYEIFVVLSRTQSIYNVRPFRQIHVLLINTIRTRPTNSKLADCGIRQEG